MMFLYSIFGQWFSRGCLIKSCLAQEKWEVLLLAFAVGHIVGSPVQGSMSDKVSRKKILLFTILSVVLTMSVMVVGTPFTTEKTFTVLLAIACILNGVFGNVLPVAAAAYSEQINDFDKALRLSFICRYGALALPFLLNLPDTYGFLIALGINAVSLGLVALKYRDNVPSVVD